MPAMDGANIIWTLAAGLITLAILSFLYKDNPLYKMAEHIAVGVSVGFLVVTYYYNVFRPKVWDNIFTAGQYDYVIPLILGLFLFARFIPRYGWLSRWSIAFYIGGFAGLSIPSTLEGRVLTQTQAAIAPLLVRTGEAGFSLLASVEAMFMVIGTLACLVFFFFSVEHKGPIGKLAYFGRLAIMAGFGASFGYTVMARVSLLIGRVQFLTRDFVDAIRGIFQAG